MSEVSGITTDETADLVATVEEVRKAGFPGLDRRLVEDILNVQRRYADAEDRAEARKVTEQIVNQWVAANVQT
ncbi:MULTISPECIES: hypothetical protein [Streptomyces]|uniref:hypothetical protein n=1 Tax=Streptomyces TaxID=1883 RepID=UPI0036FCDB4C